MKNLCNLIKLNKGGKGGGKGGGGSVSGGSVEDELAELDRLMARPIILVEVKAGLVLGTSAPVMLFYDPANTHDPNIFNRMAEYLSIDGKHYYMVYGDTVEECNKNLGAFLKEHGSMIQTGAKPIYMRNEDGLQLGFVGGLAGLLVRKYGLKSKDALALAQILLSDGVSFGPGNVREIDLNKIIVGVGERDPNYTSFREKVDAEIDKELGKILQEVCDKNGGFISVTRNKDKANYETYQITPSNDTFTITKMAYGGNKSDYGKYMEQLEKKNIKHAGDLLYSEKDDPDKKAKMSGPHAHHIVPKGQNMSSTIKAREKLVEYGINPYYAPENLCVAQNAGHSEEYSDAVYNAIKDLTSRKEIVEKLDEIAIGLKNGTFPPPTTGSKQLKKKL